MVRVHVPDRPGAISGIAQALGAARVNIEDFVLHHISPEQGGTAEITVAGTDAAARAVTCSTSRATAPSPPASIPGRSSA